MSNIKQYFVTSHTAHGFVNYLASNISEVEVYLVSHPSLTFKTQIFQQLINYFSENDEPIEVLISGHSKHYIEGVIVPSRSLAIVANHIMSNDRDVKQEFAFGRSIDVTEKHKAINETFQQAYNYIAESLQTHMKIEDFYIQVMDFNRSNELIAQVKEQFITSNVRGDLRQGKIYQRLFGSNTIHGNYNIVPELLPTVERRLYLQGGPGTGKSVFMKEIVKSCLANGYDVEQYMCSFDPSSIDMVIVPKLSFCILDSTGSHKFSPLSDQDVVIDLFKQSRTSDIEEQQKEAMTQIKDEQRTVRKKGNALMHQAGQQIEALEKMLMHHVTQAEIDRKVSAILAILL